MSRNHDAPIIILGAARSGTKLLRSLIAAPQDFAEIPDDINFVWRYGNYLKPDDQLHPADLSPAARRYIRRFFAKARGARQSVVEKTVSNTLRVGFVREVFPHARFIQLIRDGRDVSASSRRMWQAPLEWRRVLGKLRHFPLRAAPTYGLDYLRNYLGKERRSESRVRSWGPRFAGIDQFLLNHTLLETCGRQWQACVEATQAGLADLPSHRKLSVRFEDLCGDPEPELKRVADFLQLDSAAPLIDKARRSLVAENIGKHRSELSSAERRSLELLLGETLAEFGYA